MKKLITTSILFYIGIVLAVFLFGYVTDNNVNKQRAYDNNQVALMELTDSVFKYAEYSTAEFEDLDLTTPAKMTLCGYTSEQSKLAKENNTASPCTFWNQMNSARFDFHEKTIKARVITSDSVVESLDNIEAGFMQVFDKVISEAYYMRTYQDNYNLIMPQLFEELENNLREELK